MRSERTRRLRVQAAAFNELVSNATQTFEVAFHEAAGTDAGAGREGSDLQLYRYIGPDFALATHPQPVGTLRGYVNRGHQLPARFEGGAHGGMHFIFTLSSSPPAETRVGQWGQTVIGTYRVDVRAKPVPVEAAVPAQAQAVVAVMKAAGAKSYAYAKLPVHARESIYPKPAPDSRWIYAEVSAPALYRIVGAREGHANFGDYHRAYMDRRGRGRTHSGWAVVLDSVGPKIITDGWEEFHDWIDQGARKIPCVAPHPPKAGAEPAPAPAAPAPGRKKPPGPPGLAPAPAPAPKSATPRTVRRPSPVQAPAPRPSRPGISSPAPTTPAPSPVPTAPAAAPPKTGTAADLPREGTCAIHSLAHALGITANEVWAKVHDLWADGGRSKAGMSSRDIWRSLQRFGKGYRSRPDLFRPNGDEGRTTSFKTVITRLAKIRGPAFLVQVDAHVVCIKDGKLMDTWKTPAGSHVRDVGEVTDNASETPLNDRRLEDLTGRYVEGRDENGAVRRGVYLNKGKVFVERTDYTGYELLNLDPVRDTGKQVPAKLRTALKRAYAGKPTGGGARSPMGPKVGSWVQAIFRKPNEIKVWSVSGIYIGANRIIVDFSVPGKPNVGVLNIEDPRPARGKPTAAQTAFYKQVLENSRNKAEAAVPTPYHLRKADATRVVENEFYRLAPARYAKGQMQVTFPPNESRWKTTPMSLAEDCGGRWVNRTGGYIMSPRQAERFEAAVARWVAERKAAGNPVRNSEVGASLSDFCARNR